MKFKIACLKLKSSHLLLANCIPYLQIRHVHYSTDAFEADIIFKYLLSKKKILISMSFHKFFFSFLGLDIISVFIKASSFLDNL